MVTIAEDIIKKSRKLNEWLKANPGIPLVYGPDEERVFFERSLLDDPAFRKLSRGAILVYLDFLGKRKMEKDRFTKRWYIKNNGQIVYTYSEAQDKGISKTQFRDWIDELIANGFLGLAHQGKGGRKPRNGEGDASKYFISERWKNFNDDEFKHQKRKKDDRQGRGFSLIWNDPIRREDMLQKRRETIERKKRQKDADEKQI